MIDRIKGNVEQVHDQAITVRLGDAEGMSVSLSVAVPSPLVFSQGKIAELEMYMHWNSEQGPSLFGFTTKIEKQIFMAIIGCSGIGPRLGLAILNHMTPSSLIDAVTTDDAKALSKVSGIGPRKAEHIIVQLRPKVTSLVESGIDLGVSHAASNRKEIAEALQSLSYSRQEVKNAMQYLNKNHFDSDKTFDVLLRHALSFLSKRL